MGHVRNPILDGCHPDPSICRVGDEYYLATSSFEYLPGIPIHRSKNLVDWEIVGHAIDRPDQLDLSGLPGSRGLYAPSLRHHDGRFVVVCTLVGAEGDTSDRRLGHFVVTAQDPAGPWSDPVWIEGAGGIDPSVTFVDGRVWLCGTRLAEPGRWSGQTDVWLVELDPDSFQTLSEPVVIWQGAMIGAVWAEGPHLYPRPGGGWMLVAAEGGTSRDHAVCVAYADEITGPYRPDLANPRLSHRDLGNEAEIVDVGHADLVEGPDGRWWATVIAVHAENGANGLLGRQTHLVPVGWEDGRPLFAPGVGRVERTLADDALPDRAASEESAGFRDDFDEAVLAREWTAVGRMPHTFVDLAARPGWARLAASDVDASRVGDLAYLGRRLPAERGCVRADVEWSPGARAGLLLRVSEDAFFEVSVGDEDVVVRIREKGEMRVLCERRRDDATGASDATGAGAAALEIELDGFAATARVDGVDLAHADLRRLAPDGDGTFVGAWVGVVAVGAGVVDVDAIEMRALS
ncbi:MULTISPECIES: glycoside hydrolase family 43 protein [unclassified Microbacterium]|uniref:glycoside hydrolase family 43 protein n=1 Tax=unclassified Microbacterium TaxID=2609290 RepID=UPI00301B1DE0